ncbi:MAG: hypothetical protein RLZ10_1109 [Bacteroidota bacterium]|jgi:hypothetical protein
MKKYIFFGFLSLFTLLNSCGDKNENTTSNAKNLDFYQFFKFDLSQYDIPATIMLPDETVGIGTSFIPEVKHNEADFLWEINIGPNFVFFIEDYGDMANLVKTHKAKILDINNTVYSVKVLVDEPELFIYERRIKGKEKEVPTYHAYAQKKINGVYYEFKNSDSGNIKKVIDCIEKTFRSIKEIK